MRRSYLVCFFCLVLGSFTSVADDKIPAEITGLRYLTEYLGLKPSDISFRDDYTEPDSFRLQVVTNLMSRPLEMIDYTASVKGAYVKSQPEIIASVLFQDLARVGQTSRRSAYRANVEEIIKSYNLYFSNFQLNQLLTRAAVYLDVIFPRSTDMSLERLTRNEKKFLLKEFLELQVIHEEEEFYSVEAIDSVEKAETEYAEQFVEFGTKIDTDPIVSAGVDCLRELILEASHLRQLLKSGNVSAASIMEGTVYLPDNVDLNSYLGRQSGWAIGGAANDYYSGNYKFILDFGGDDIYDLEHDPSNSNGTIIIDLDGNDSYRARTNFVLGSGCLSAGLLLDFSGDDRYDAKSFGLGSGFFGLGVLYDAGGNDSYRGDTFVQGAGCFGLGLLIDEQGWDIYHAAMSAQGYAFVGGIGALFDTEGNDCYYAGGKYKDILRYEDHFYSFSQGFAIGMRPFFSGGIGALVDFGGNDNYLSDIFAQASSYWWSLGLIYDQSGNDNYQSFQYAQGAGTHMSIGILIDDAGNDMYFAKGVSQGCGHDYSCGLLLDRAGDDTYTAYDLSQAAGSANGVGIVIDNTGNDRYLIKNPNNTHGYGNPRREYGSIGLFIDLGGEDQYTGHGQDNLFWRTDSKWGGGMDFELNPPDSTESTP